MYIMDIQRRPSDLLNVRYTWPYHPQTTHITSFAVCVCAVEVIAYKIERHSANDSARKFMRRQSFMVSGHLSHPSATSHTQNAHTACRRLAGSLLSRWWFDVYVIYVVSYTHRTCSQFKWNPRVGYINTHETLQSDFDGDYTECVRVAVGQYRNHRKRIPSNTIGLHIVYIYCIHIYRTLSSLLYRPSTETPNSATNPIWMRVGSKQWKRAWQIRVRLAPFRDFFLFATPTK